MSESETNDAGSPITIDGDEATQGGYVVVPRFILHHPTLSHAAKLTLQMLLDYAWQGDHCFPGQLQLAADLRVTDRSVRSYLAELRDAGLVSWTQPGMGKHNVYTLVFRCRSGVETDDRSGRKVAAGQTGTQLPRNITHVNTTHRNITDSPSAGISAVEPTPAEDFAAMADRAEHYGITRAECFKLLKAVDNDFTAGIKEMAWVLDALHPKTAIHGVTNRRLRKQSNPSGLTKLSGSKALPLPPPAAEVEADNWADEIEWETDGGVH